ncbi:MAG: hypothetical protein RLZZ502_158 [Pseudomonadota bacterium]
MLLNSSPSLRNAAPNWLKRKFISSPAICFLSVLCVLCGACSTVTTVGGAVGGAVGSVAVGTVKVAAGTVGIVTGVAYDGAKIVAGGVVSGVTAGAVATVVVVKNITVSSTLLALNAAISAASLVGNVVVWGIALSRDKDDGFHTMLMHIGPNTFQSNEGRIVRTKDCPQFEKSLPALLSINKKGESEIRLAGRRCSIEQVEQLA